MISLVRNVPILYLLKVTTALGFIYPIWYLFEQQFLSISEIALIEMVIVLSQLLFEIPTGAVADVFGYKTSILLGHLTTIVALGIFAFSHSFFTFLLYAIISGLGESLKSGAEEAMEYDTFSSLGQAKEFARIKNKFSLVFQITLALAFISGGIIAEHFGYSLTIWLTIGATFLSTLLTWFMTEPPVARQKHSLTSYFNQWSLGYREVTKNESTKSIAGFYALVGSISWPVNISLLMMFLTQMQLTASTQGTLLGIVRIANILILTQIIRKTNHHNDVQKIMVAYLIIFALGYLPAIIAVGPMVPLMAMIILISTTARWNVVGPLVHHRLESKNRATAMSTLSMVIGISHATVMGVAALAFNFVDGPKGMITIMGLIGVLGTLWLRHKYINLLNYTKSA